MKFDKQVAIVTGAGQGIGFEIARQLALQGASVILNDSKEEYTQAAVKSISAEGGVVFPMTGDSSDFDFIQQMVDQAVKQFGSLSIVIANSGITIHGDFFTYTPENFQKTLSINLFGSFFLAQAAASQIRKQKTGGSILFMSSVNGHQANKYLAAYSMTKAGLEMLAKNLVVELSDYDITVNTVAPGATLTDRTRQEQDDFEGVWAGITPLKRIAYPKDIADAVLFLVSPQARMITGQSLVVDGGWTSISPSPNKTV